MVFNNFKSAVLRLFSMLGYEIRSIVPEVKPIEYKEADDLIWERVKSETMTSFLNFWFLLKSVDYLIDNKIQGSFVECGVWRGGSAMAMAMRLVQHNSSHVDLYLFDTYSGMVAPSIKDIEAHSGLAASDLMKKATSGSFVLADASLKIVKANMESTNYLKDKIHYIEGDVIETLNTVEIHDIALLRLDTDWYESTRAELRQLLPRLVRGGICIIDDYGHWEGSRKAVDEFFKNSDFLPLMFHVDYTCRAFIRT
jgi:hypothetical protein